MQQIENKTIVVTGGAGLIGRSFCRAISDAGGRVVIADIAKEPAEAVAADLKGAEAMVMDITDTASVAKAVSEVTNKFGRIDGLVNNAYPRNANYGRCLEDVELADFNQNTSMHLGGYFNTMQVFAKAMSQQPLENNSRGTIVNMSSIYGLIAPRFEVYEGTTMTMPVEYAAIKSAINHLTLYFAQYYKRQGLRFNALSPGGVADNQNPDFQARYNKLAGAKGMLEPSDVADALIFLLSDASSAITGQNIVVDDGFSL